MKSPGETSAMELTQPKLARMEIMPTYALPNSTRFLTRTADQLKARFKVLWRSAIWKSLVSHARSQRKALSVRETASLGERRFVSVIQFERQRFLIGSSPASVTLLAQLPDQPQSGEEIAEESKQESKEESGERN